jgi:hypothetical protein
MAANNLACLCRFASLSGLIFGIYKTSSDVSILHHWRFTQFMGWSRRFVVIDRKNFLFANTPRGAKTSAIMFSLIETAKENGLNPFKYLVYVFKNAPNWDIHNNISMLEFLIPHLLPDHCTADLSG